MNKSKKEEKMKGKISNRSFPFLNTNSRRGFTVIEVLVGSSIMLTIILLTLSLYTKSNKVSVDQQQLSELQHDVRAAMYFLSRDIKSIGAGLPQQFSPFFLEGDNNDKKSEHTDKLTFLGTSDPLRLIIQDYDKKPNTITLEPNQFELYPYTATAYPDDPKGYINRVIIILPNPDLYDKKGGLGKITGVDFGANEITFDKIKGKLPRELDLKLGGKETDYVGGSVHFVELKQYWLDVTGKFKVKEGEGYLGQPGVLYVSRWSPVNGSYDHMPLAQNIEDLQFQYHGDMDADQQLDDNNSDGIIDVNDYLNWDDKGDKKKKYNWKKDEVVSGIRSVRILILGKTANPFIGFSGTPPDQVKYIYGKPMVADSPAEAQPDKHRRFLLESTANIRNMSLNLYNSGTT